MTLREEAPTAAGVWKMFQDCPTEFVALAVQRMSEAGLLGPILEIPASFGTGVVFFGRFTAELCSLVREASRGGQERILAVAAPIAKFDSNANWLLLAAGASDVMTWDTAEVSATAIAARIARWAEIDELIRSPGLQDRLVGSGATWTSMLRQVVEAARFSDASILITGESGTGKELIARLIHDLDPRPNRGGLVLVDCTTIVPTLSGSEFFGHEKGAFTGAIATRDGAFALADGGTLFLDEVGELALSLQAELLRVIQEGMYKRVGSNTWRRTRFRLVCATNRDLLQEVSQGRFRRDLYYRIATWTARLPSLSDRREDIPALIDHFLRQQATSGSIPKVDSVVLGFLLHRPYQGNVRELKQLVLKIANRHQPPGPISVGDVPMEERPFGHGPSAEWRDLTFERCVGRALAQGATLQEIQRAAGDTAIRIAVSESNGNLLHASKQLGVTPRALQLRRAANRNSRAIQMVLEGELGRSNGDEGL